MSLSTEAFGDFNSVQRHVFDVRSVPQLDIRAACDIAILPGDSNRVIVEIDAETETLEDFLVTQGGGKILICHLSKSSGNAIIGDVVIGNVVQSFSNEVRSTVVSSGGQNISIVNGRVYVNGREVTQDGSATGKPTPKAPRIRVYAPSSNLDLSLSGSASFVSAVPMVESFVYLKGSAKVGLPTESLELNLSGSGEVQAKINGGYMTLNLSGSGSVSAVGAFSNVRVDLSGMAQVSTSGEVRGNYSVNASGMGRVSHSGRIKGSVRKNLSGMVQVSLPE